MANMFDENGNYNKTEWKPGDRITAGKLNKIEESLEAINNNDIERHKEADERLDALEEQNEAANDRFDELEDLVADNKTEIDVLIYENNVKMDRLETKLDDGIDTVEAIAHTVDDKIAEADASMKAQVAEAEDIVDQGKADMEAMVAEVEADLEGLHAKDEELSEQLVYIETYNILKYNNLVVNGDYSNAIQTCLNENSICFLPQGEYNVNSTILIKTGQMLYGAGQRKTIIKANHSNSIVNLDGTGIVINRLTLNRNSVITDKSNGIDIGSSFLGQSRIQDIEIINNRIGLYCNSNTNFYSNVISNIWVSRYTYSAIWLEPYGSTGCVFENIYTTNWDDYTNQTKIIANTGFFIKNFSECSINQLNIEHTILNNAITTNSCDSIDFGTVHIEGLESIDIYGGILNTITTNKVKIKTLILVFSKCYNGIEKWNILVNNGKNTNIHLEKFISRNNNKNNADYTHLCLCLNNSNKDDISIEIDYINDKDNLFNNTSGYVEIDGGRKHQIKRFGNKINYNNIGDNIETYLLSGLPVKGYWLKGDRIVNNNPNIGEYEKYICIESGEFSNIEFGAIVNTTAYQSAIKVLTGDINYGDVFNIDGINYKALSNKYGDNLINVEPMPNKTLSNATVYKPKCKFSKSGLIESL